ncbi:alpha-2-macroglobulin family protein [Hahella sp. NBU794]|uniref:alpha-2-macroglobulin family protein n=1 Tax=Hahella sp. NBU794 TaxID=3422590 RepID=UPI003D6ED5AA
MTSARSGFLFLLAISASGLTWAGQPSFNCAKASQQVEHIICDSEALAAQDAKLAKLYGNVMKSLDGSAKDKLKSEQREWLRNRNRDCDLNGDAGESCLLGRYRQRNAELSAMLAFDSSSQPADGELRIMRITPSGADVLAAQQVVFQFDRPVVPIGRMERDSKDIPVTITPALKCEWRWLNTSALACQLRNEDKMQQATYYEITMRPGIKTVTGAQLKQPVEHSFTTARPKVTYERFVNWLSPGAPMIQITFNQPVTKSSVEKTLTMSAESTGLPPVNVIAYPDNLPRQQPWWMAIANDEEQPKVNDQLTQLDGDEARSVWVIEPKKELPLDQNITLQIKPGLISSEGSEPGAENRILERFDTYPDFRFVGIRCTPTGANEAMDIELDLLLTMREGYEEFIQCAPLRSVALLFTSPVTNSMVRDQVTFEPPLNGGRKDYDPWENTQDWTHLTSPHRNGRFYQVWLPELLKADQKYAINLNISDLTDEFGRKLNNKVSFNFFTGHREPRLEVAHDVAVLEKGVESDVPLYVTNLNKIDIAYNSLGANQSGRNQRKVIPVAPAEDISYATPMGVRDLLGDASGVLFGSLTPSPTPPDWYYDPKIFAEVTPYQVHFKLGHFNSMAWVTSFSSGEPVANANVSLWFGSYENLPGLRNLNITAKTDANGMAPMPGLEEIDPQLESIYGGRSADREGFFVKVEQAGDIAIVPLNSNFSVWDRDLYPSLQRKGGHAHAWGTTAQGVYKLGDKVQFKIYVREQSNKHWVEPYESNYSLKVFDPQNKVVYERNNIGLNKFGAFDGEFTLPEQGAVGWHQFQLTLNAPSGSEVQETSWTPVTVLVSDFTPSPFKVKTELNGNLFRPNDSVQVTSLATLHSGGPYTEAEVRLTAKLTPKEFSSSNPVAKGFTFGGDNNAGGESNLLDIRRQLDDAGQYVESFILPDSGVFYGNLMVEAAVKDERGKFVASSTTADYAGRTRYVGLRNTQWLYKKDEPARLETLVVDQSGAPVAGAPVRIAINHREYKASRVKGPGNAYLTQNIMEWVEETQCELKSDTTAATCEFKPQKPGYYQFVATVNDTENREHSTTLYGWVTGSGSVVWDQSNDATLQIVPEQTKFKIGDTARYLIKNPFPGAKALISIERYGILDSWVQTLDSSTPVIEVPVKADYLPGFYLSVVVVSPRVEKPLGPGHVDLGKPSYRMGYVAAKVVDPLKELDISVATDKEVYKPREQVKAKIRINRKKTDPAEGYEIAVAVIDESVLALNRSGDNYYDPYAGFNRLDQPDVYNYNLISRLVGRQKFEKKGANPGGGGAASAQLRNEFKFVSYWNPAIEPDDNGEAEIEFKVPDNLTGWRIFAFAVTKEDRMGLGDVTFKVNRPTEIRPVMPNQVIEGDRFKAGFNVMNRTDKERTIKMDVRVKGPLAEGAEHSFTRELKIGPYKRENIWLPIDTKGGGELIFTAKGGDQVDTDALEHKTIVNKRRSLETAATYGTTTEASVSENVQVPEGIFEDVGYIGAVLSPSVIGNLDGAFAYIRDYPYMCWEQRLTKAAMARSYLELKEYLAEDTQWPEAQKDIDSAMNAAANFQAPNGGMAYWVASNAYVSPYLSAYTAMAFNWMRASGHEVPVGVEQRLHEYLLTLLRQDSFPTFYSKGMSSSVRAVALAALAEAGKIDQSDVSRYERHLPEMDLFGKAHFLQAAVRTEHVPQSVVSKSMDDILSHASQSGGKFQFNEPWDDSYSYILATPLRSNCAVLSSLLGAQTEAGMGSTIGDIPFKLVRSITQSRGSRDHWENTQENVFCLNALVNYASIYEKEDPAMKVSVNFDGKDLGSASFNKKSDPMKTVSRPLTAADPGKAATLTIEKEGEGRLYYSARIAYDLREDNAARINSGIEIRREYSVERNGKFELLKSPMQIRRGELVKVDLFVSIPTARHFVVVNDPIPGGLEPVNADLATASQVDADKGEFKAADGSWFYTFSDWSYYGRYFWSFYHKELRHDSARFYADYLPAGNYFLSYTAQAIAEGEFSVMPVHAEEMYDPDVYGKGLPATLNVGE